MIVRKYRSTEVYEISDPITEENMPEIARWCGGVPCRDLFNDWAIFTHNGSASFGQRIIRGPDGKFRIIWTLDGFEPLLQREGDADDIEAFSQDMKSQLRERRGNASFKSE